MSRIRQLDKALQLLRRPRFAQAMLRHRIGATTEHFEVIRLCKAATLLDIGANKGQFSLAYREFFPEGWIVAFEPFPESAGKFRALFAGDARAELHQTALADAECEAHFHVTTRQDSSSLLEPGAAQEAAYGVRDAAAITVPVKRLDQIVDMGAFTGPVLLKIDVQGAELKVLEGCADLGKADFLYIELSFVELYKGQPLFDEVEAYLRGRGFVPVGFFNQSVTEQFGPTQVDVLFARQVGPGRLI
jgi:FkbM family methyltransferase